MDAPVFSTVPYEDEVRRTCPCCGRPIYVGAGELHANGLPVADYWYEWAEGHARRFYLAVCGRDGQGEPIEGAGVGVCEGRIEDENLVYAVLEPEDSPWSEFGAFGPVLPRADVLGGAAHFFELVDAVAANEDRLSRRIIPT